MVSASDTDWTETAAHTFKTNVGWTSNAIPLHPAERPANHKSEELRRSDSGNYFFNLCRPRTAESDPDVEVFKQPFYAVPWLRTKRVPIKVGFKQHSPTISGGSATGEVDNFELSMFCE